MKKIYSYLIKINSTTILNKDKMYKHRTAHKISAKYDQTLPTEITDNTQFAEICTFFILFLRNKTFKVIR